MKISQIKMRSGENSILLLVILWISKTVAIDEVIFYDEINFQGEKTYLHLGSGCYNLDADWNNRVASIDLQGNCLEVFDKANCLGRPLELASWEQTAPYNLDLVGFKKLLTSLRVCGAGGAIGGRRLEPPPGTIGDRNSNRQTRQQKKTSAANQVAIQEHNKYRRRHMAPPLVEDLTMSSLAQQHADYLAYTGKFEPLNGVNYGENLATSFEPDRVSAVRDVVKRWYDKIQYYSFENPESNQYRHKSEHFSSIVWRSTRRIGIGVAQNFRNRKWVVVVFYDPPATNYNYEENVFKPLYT